MTTKNAISLCWSARYITPLLLGTSVLLSPQVLASEAYNGDQHAAERAEHVSTQQNSELAELDSLKHQHSNVETIELPAPPDDSITISWQSKSPTDSEFVILYSLGNRDEKTILDSVVANQVVAGIDAEPVDYRYSFAKTNFLSFDTEVICFFWQ